jgi:hypothetical protein
MKYLLEKINSTRGYLLLANIFLAFFLILLSNLKILPLESIGDFLFLIFVVLAFALYRPGWAFLFFIGTIALENINLAPASLGVAVRPYQFFAALIIIAILVRFAVKRLNFEFPKFHWADGLLIIFAVAGFLSAFGSEASKISFKQSIVAMSFVAIYFLVRIFIQNTEDLKKVIPFFLSSSIIVVLYGIWQNVRFSQNLSNFEAMPGRPNSTFTEADWLGIFLVFLIAVIYSTIYFFLKNGSEEKSVISNQFSTRLPDGQVSKFTISKIFFYFALTASYIVLILTVPRSAWLGALAVTIAYLLIIFMKLKLNPREWQWKNTLKINILILISLTASIAIVHIFHLTNFQLFNRAESTGSGLQKITVSCLKNEELSSSEIQELSSLEKIGCRHINLEEINSEKERGNFVTEVYRKDPNINIRSEIYQKSWQQIKTHPILGIGWGSIGKVLGQDGQGTPLNSSNIFFEIWLGAGILGLASFLAIWLYIPIKSLQNFYTQSAGFPAYSLFIVLAWLALTIPNLFNAGIFLGFLWVFSGIAISLLNSQEK